MSSWQHAADEGLRPEEEVLANGAPPARRFALSAALSIGVGLKLDAAIENHAPQWRMVLSGSTWLYAALVAEFLLCVVVLSRHYRAGALGVLLLVPCLVVWLAILARLGVSPQDCGCFGRWEAPVGAHVAYLGGLAAPSLAVLLAPRPS